MNEPGADEIILEHGRRNFDLRRDGKLSVLCPIRDESDISGVRAFATSVEEPKKIYDEDSAVKAGILWYEVHATGSFPGDALPK